MIILLILTLRQLSTPALRETAIGADSTAFLNFHTLLLAIRTPHLRRFATVLNKFLDCSNDAVSPRINRRLVEIEPRNNVNDTI